MSYIDLPIGEDGWHVFTPSADSRVMYVSGIGDDATGIIYENDSFVDYLEPTGEMAFATVAGAAANCRDGYPDFVLLKRGETFTDTLGKLGNQNGRSATEPRVFVGYGGSGLSPVLKTGSNYGFTNVNITAKWNVISGIVLYATTRDPGHLDYINDAGGVGFHWFVGAGNTTEGWLLEGCKIRFHTSNVQLTGGGGGALATGVLLHRCVILDAYDEVAHAQGVWADGIDGIRLSECIIDHNGWYSQSGSGQPGEADIFSHNLYMGSPSNLELIDCIFSRSGSIGAKLSQAADVLSPSIRGNLFIDNEIALSLASNYPETYYGVVGADVTGNVCCNAGRSKPTARALAWGFDVIGWDGGSLTDNYYIHQDDPTLSGMAFTISCYANSVALGYSIDTPMRGVLFDGNVCAKALNTLPLTLIKPSLLEDVSITNNILQSENMDIISADSAISASAVFSRNEYNSSKTDPFLTVLGGINFYRWSEDVGDSSAFRDKVFYDSTRTIETYMESIGETPTIEQFFLKIREQDRYSWDSRFTAIEVVSWLKAGFQLVPATFHPPNTWNGSNNKYKYPAEAVLVTQSTLESTTFGFSGSTPVAFTEAELTAYQEPTDVVADWFCSLAGHAKYEAIPVASAVLEIDTWFYQNCGYTNGLINAETGQQLYNAETGHLLFNEDA